MWGCGSNGRLGTGSTDSQFRPRMIVKPESPEDPFRFKAIACGHHHSLGIGSE